MVLASAGPALAQMTGFFFCALMVAPEKSITAESTISLEFFMDFFTVLYKFSGVKN